jgi:hypothetical protein
MADETVGRTWPIPAQFLVDVLVNTVLFLAIAAAAVGLNLLVHKLEGLHIDPLIVRGLTHIEYIIFFADLLLFVRFMWLAAAKAWSDFDGDH